MKVTEDGTYRMGVSDHLQYVVLWFLVCGCVGWLFYDQILFIILALPAYGLFYRKLYRLKTRKYQMQMRQDFKDVMLSIYSSLSAGTTLEESIKRALEDMKRSLPAESRMILELDIICKKMETNISVTQGLEDMALRCKNRDIENFIQVLILAKKQGGNMSGLVRDSVGKIQGRIETTYEIEGIIGAKRNEFIFMCVIPAGVILYMRVFSSEFMDVLYGNMVGMVVMTVCLAIYIGALLLGIAILKMENG